MSSQGDNSSAVGVDEPSPTRAPKPNIAQDAAQGRALAQSPGQSPHLVRAPFGNRNNAKLNVLEANELPVAASTATTRVSTDVKQGTSSQAKVTVRLGQSVGKQVYDDVKTEPNSDVEDADQ